MDLPLFFRVLWRFWWLVLIGVLIASALAILSVFRISTDDGSRSSTGRARNG